MLHSASREIYLDSQATTPVDERVLREMLPFFATHFSNPSSSHPSGLKVQETVELQRSDIAGLFGVSAEDFFFTSGATESNNLVFELCSRFLPELGKSKVLVSAIEHKSVLDSAKKLKKQGFEILEIPVLTSGRVSAEALESMLDPTVGLVSVMAANNEIGSIQDVELIGQICREAGALFHCDFVQGVGFVPFKPYEHGIAFATFSAHKLYGPKGIGALFVAGGMKPYFQAAIVGGPQEFGLRAGTLNVPGIVGFAKALEFQLEESAQRCRLFNELRSAFLEVLDQGRVQYELNGAIDRRLPQNLNLWFRGVVAEELILGLPGVTVSNGSACNSRAISPSHVLTAIGCDRNRAFESVRVSFCKGNSLADVVFAAEQIKNRILKMSLKVGMGL